VKNLNRKIWIWLLGIILVASIVGTALPYFLKDKPERVEVYKDGVLVEAASLIGEDVEIPVNDGEEENIVIISDGKVSMKYATCPDKLCVKQGEISNGNTPIVCLPNRVVVKLTGGETTEVDAIAK